MGWVVSITPRPRFTPWERAPGTHCTGGGVGPRAGVDAEVGGKILCPCRGSNPGPPFRSQTLYWLSYAALHICNTFAYFSKAVCYFADFTGLDLLLVIGLDLVHCRLDPFVAKTITVRISHYTFIFLFDNEMKWYEEKLALYITFKKSAKQSFRKLGDIIQQTLLRAFMCLQRTACSKRRRTWLQQKARAQFGSNWREFVNTVQ
jgi:hypothetical protein